MSASEEAQPPSTNSDPNDQSLKFAVAISLLRSKVLQNRSSPSESDALRWKRKVPLTNFSYLCLVCHKIYEQNFVVLLCFFLSLIESCLWRFRLRSESKRYWDSEKISRKPEVLKFLFSLSLLEHLIFRFCDVLFFFFFAFRCYAVRSVSAKRFLQVLFLW